MMFSFLFDRSMPDTTFRIATRKSPLALWQAQSIANQLRNLWPAINVELVPLTTSGDRFLSDKLLTIGGKGLFVKELEDALIQHKADIAVHSMKDVPSFFPPGLGIPVITSRDNPYDALVSLHHEAIETLPHGACIGTSSLRRQSQLLACRPDLRIETIRGNIHTRLEKLESNPFDAIILAAAGLKRMNLQNKIKQIISADLMLPACGQGALGIECRLDDTVTQTLIAPLNDMLTQVCVTTERQLNALLGGNCHAPIGVYCQVQDNTRLLLRARILSPDGCNVISGISAGLINVAHTLADICAEDLFNQGAKQFLTCL